MTSPTIDRTSMNDIFDLTDRVVVVTGASSGLGAHIAGVLAGRGAKVVLMARRADQLARIADGIPGAIALTGDVTSDDDCRRVAEAAYEAHGRVDVLINNAGLSRPASVADETVDDFRRVVDVNLHGTYSMSRHIGLRMVEQGNGSIVNVASIVGLVGLGRMPQASYAASKAGVVNLTRELAAQWARKGVRVNAIAPGFFPSEMTEGLFDNDAGTAWVAKLTPMGRGARDDEMDGALVYLASDASSYVTGSVLTVDGGWTAV
jgi:NAD(P)-dependent dehydrogenase (short-subunit alcohol dehydrogenase family)